MRVFTKPQCVKGNFLSKRNVIQPKTLQYHSYLTKYFLQVLFVPFALRKQDEYAAKAREPFEKWGFEFSSLHTEEDKVSALKSAQALFIGGGNTFQLLNSLYQFNILDVIRKRVLDEGMPYIGSSAGTNVSTYSINTTNDMPIVHPPSFKALQLVPFNINPHFLDTVSFILTEARRAKK